MERSSWLVDWFPVEEKQTVIRRQHKIEEIFEIEERWLRLVFKIDITFAISDGTRCPSLSSDSNAFNKHKALVGLVTTDTSGSWK